MKISIIILSLDEIQGVRVILPRIKRDWYDELIVIDGGSSDGTVEYLEKNGYPVFIQKEKGYFAAFNEAIERSSGDVLIFLSPDGNSIPEKIPEVVEEMKKGYDIVIVSRYLKGAKSYDDDIVTSLGNRFFTGLINILFRTKITDSLVMYRAYKRSVLDEFRVGPKTGSIGSRILLRALKKNLSIKEIPGDEPSRIGGIRKMHPLKNGLGELMMIFNEFFTGEKFNL